MKKINARLDSISSPFNNIAPWFFRIALGIAFFFYTATKNYQHFYDGGAAQNGNLV